MITYFLRCGMGDVSPRHTCRRRHLPHLEIHRRSFTFSITLHDVSRRVFPRIYFVTELPECDLALIHDLYEP